MLHAPDDTGQPFSCQATKKQLQRISKKLSLNKTNDMLLALTSWRSKDHMLLKRLLASNLEAAGRASIRCAALLKKQLPHLPSKEFFCKC